MKSAVELKNSALPFVGVDQMVDLVTTVGVEKFMRGLANYIEEDFKRWPLFDKSPRYASHSQEGVIELMPTSDGSSFTFKYVNGHPKNTKVGLQTVTAFGVLSDVNSGYPILLSEMTVLTALRTAATSAMVAKYLAPEDSTTMAMIGNGAQSEFQALAFKEIIGINTVRLYDIDPAATEKAVKNLTGKGLEIIACKSREEAIDGAQIITTCTADKRYATILEDSMVSAGVHINAIGGDCPGKTELDGNILKRGDIFVEYEPQARIEGDIQQLDSDHPVTEFWQVILGKAPGRKNREQITIFDGVGFSVEDFSALRFLYDQLNAVNNILEIDLIAQPNDPRNLFGFFEDTADNKNENFCGNVSQFG